MLSMLVTVAMVLSQPGVASPEEIPDRIEFRESRDVVGEFVARTIMIDRGVRLTLIGNARFEALETIDVFGDIDGAPAAEGDGPSLELIAGEGVRVFGTVSAGDGGEGREPGEEGGRGGDLSLVAPLLLCKSHAPTAGAGGRGGPGGAGGEGGHPHVTAIAVNLAGKPLTIVGSRGGDGGPGQVGLPAASGGPGGGATASAPDERGQRIAHDVFRRWTGRTLVPQRRTSGRALEPLTPATAGP